MEWNIIIPQFFYDMIGRFCPGVIVMISGWAVVDGPTEMLNHFLTVTNNKSVEISIYAFFILALGAYFIADMLYQVWKFLCLTCGYLRNVACGDVRCNKKASETTNLDNWKKRYAMLLEKNWIVTKQEMLAETYIMLDDLRIHKPDEAHRLLKIRAEMRLSAVIVIGYALLAIFNYFYYIKYLGSSDDERNLLLIFLVSCALLSYFRHMKYEAKYMNGIAIAWLNCIYEPYTNRNSSSQSTA